MFLPSLQSLLIGNTQLLQLKNLCPSGNLFLKLESSNPTGSVKDRTAYYLIRDVMDRLENTRFAIVESTSGNLGLGLQHIGKSLGLEIHCVIDRSVPENKIVRLKESGIIVHIAEQANYPDLRTARIEMTRSLERTGRFIWTNQYANEAGLLAHAETTGPEIWYQTSGRVDIVVCSVGSGGTICGIGRFLKERNPQVRIAAVEPKGSTIFGGEPGNYITAGAGLREASGLIARYGSVIDYKYHVPDTTAMFRCNQCFQLEGLSIGITSGFALEVAIQLAASNPTSLIVAVAPDSADNYTEYLDLTYSTKFSSHETIKK